MQECRKTGFRSRTTEWQEAVIHYGEASRKFEAACLIKDFKPGHVTIKFNVEEASLSVTLSNTEADVRTNTEITNVSDVDATISASDWKRGKISVTKQILETSMVDWIKQAKYSIMNYLEQDVDTAIATELQDTSISDRVFGGSGNTEPANLATGDVFHVDLIAEAMWKLEDNKKIARYLYIAPAQLYRLRLSSQFMNAAEHGSREMIQRGYIANFMSVDIIVTENTPAHTSAATDVNQSSSAWGATGHCCIMIGVSKDMRNIAIGLGWKERPHITYVYNHDRSVHRLYCDMCYVVKLLMASAVCLIKVTDA